MVGLKLTLPPARTMKLPGKFQMTSLGNIVCVLFVFVCAHIDVRANRIPNILTIPFSIFAIAVHTSANGFAGFVFSFIGMATGIGLLIVPYLMRGMGAGDVKMMGAVGSFLGAKATLEVFLLVAILGGIYSVALIVLRREALRGVFKHTFITSALLFSGALRIQDLPVISQDETSGGRPRLKYGVPIALGTITYLILRSFGIQSFI